MRKDTPSSNRQRRFELSVIDKKYMCGMGHSSHYNERILNIRATVGKDGKREYKYAINNEGK